MKKIKRIMCRWFPRYKLRCILRTLGLKPRPWQIKFALGQPCSVPPGRATGKTTALMLRALMMDPARGDLATIMWLDPDYIPNNHMRVAWYRDTYDQYSRRCVQAGIPVPELLPLSRTRRAAAWEVRR